MKRACGILMHITSLPSRFGVGTLGKEAFAFVDFLSAAGQSYWQMLPVNPTGYADSPYQSSSTYAGNPYLIDLEALIAEGLLTEDECDRDWGDDATLVDYGKLWENRFVVLRKAFARFDRAQMADFAEKNAWWLDTYALFCAVKTHFNGMPWYQWPDEEIVNRTPEGIAKYTELLRDEIDFQRFMQYKFEQQWEALHAYANAHKIKLIGDLPIYVPHDSADVWDAPDLFWMDKRNMPTMIAGVPPDYFSELGQLWGNPIYRWDVMEADGFAWWRRRVQAAGTRYDVLRIDHFRGLESYWGIPFGAADARPGKWYPGPGMKLVRAIKEACPDLPIIAEDLGYLTPEVKKLLSDSAQLSGALHRLHRHARQYADHGLGRDRARRGRCVRRGLSRAERARGHAVRLCARGSEFRCRACDHADAGLSGSGRRLPHEQPELHRLLALARKEGGLQAGACKAHPLLRQDVGTV